MKIYEMLARNSTAYYFYSRIECILRKQRNPTNETNKSYKGSLPPGSFKAHKSVFIVIKRRIQKKFIETFICEETETLKMKTMKTFLLFKKNIVKITLVVITVFTGSTMNGQISSRLIFDNPTLQSGTALQVGAKYLFTNVQNNVDAVISIDSLVNGAKINKFDDNSNGVGYKDAFQPAIQSGNVIGMSYAVFTIKFYVSGTSTPAILSKIYPTAIDIDGGNSLKEFAYISVGSGAVLDYMPSNVDISVLPMAAGEFMGQNILGVERNGIDTTAIANMFTVIKTNVSSFSIKYGTITTNPSSAVRQFSLYIKPFNYPGSTLPVQLASFTATLKNTNAELKWTTTSEINVSHFVIEKSTDGINFSDAGIVFAYGNANDNTNYNFSDNVSSVQSGVIYYRIRFVDNDGKSQFSETRIIRISKTKDNNIMIQAYPNPVASELRVTIPSNWQNKKITYELFNANGQTTKKMDAASSNQTETLNVNSLSPGFYIVRVSCNGETAQQKIIKK